MALPAAVHAQATDSPIVFQDNGITVSTVPATSLGGTSAPSTSNSQWLKVEFHYGIAPKAGDTVDEVQFKIWIEGRDPYDIQAATAEGVAVGLTGTVTYVNLPKGRDDYGVFYVHPNTLTRYKGLGGVSDFTRKFNIHIEATIGGQKMDYLDLKKEQDPEWYTKLKAIDGFVLRQNQSPFLVTDPDRYPQIKLPANS